MRLSRLDVRHFRNLSNQSLEFPPEGVALIGDNAQGKSNFLEAIYYLETLRSFRGARDEQMLAFDADVFRVAATLEPDRTPEGREPGPRDVAAGFQKRGRKRKVTIDGTEAEKVSEGLGHLAAVIFSPVDVDLVSGGPVERRRFLDIVLSLNEPGYLSQLQLFRKSLRHRNAALKAGQPIAAVTAWDNGLIEAGARVMVARASWIAGRSAAFCAYYARISDGQEARMLYRPNVRVGEEVPEALDGVEEAFRAALADAREGELRRGVTLVGPHRDDVRLQLVDEDSELDLRDYGSGGQRRTAALALRLIEAETIRARQGRKPLILLDDVFAELDEGRSERILDLIDGEETGQVVLTAPKDADVRIRRDLLPRWRIRAGVIEA
ncbi:MAG: DNA replication/repair protein RecF [Gemmatimonadota bacterium]